MAEERTLGLARAHEDFAEEPSKEELQRRMDEARDSISHTVTEIKETVANQVQAVKETLDWREQFKKRPVAWSVGAAGVGFLVGYGFAAIVKGDSRDDKDVLDYYSPRERSYAAQPIISGAARTESKPATEEGANGHDSGPSLFEKLTNTPAYGRVKDEVGNIGDAFVSELGKTAKQIVLPALITSIRNFIGDRLPSGSSAERSRSATMSGESNRVKSEHPSAYQPTLERGHS
jgi:hypothetical protein